MRTLKPGSRGRPIETPTHASELSPDRPLSDARADALGHANFAAHLASVITALAPKEGLVIGLYGDAGSGRTTALNLTRLALREHAGSKLTVVDWNPWLLSGGDDLEQRFVHLLANAALSSGSEQPPDPSQTAALRARVASALGSGDKRVVVLVDDVDRLAGDRREEFFRLLASVAAVPNLVFLLALERGVADAAALQKAVQLEIDLPLPDRSSLQQLFIDRMEPMLAGAREGGLVHAEYWIDICANGIDPFLRTPRDVVRLVNAVTATYTAVQGEVNPIDFTALETLRLFSPVAYDAVRRRPDGFLLPPSARRDEDGSLAATKRYHERWMDQLDDDEQNRATSLLLRLFPRLGDVLGARVLATMPEESWRPLLLVASEDVFPVYFQLAIPSGGISNADLQSKLESFGDTNQFAATLLELARDSSPDASQRLEAFLGRLENHIGESGSREELEASMRALFQAADDLLRREESGRGDIDIVQSLRRIVRRLLVVVEGDERVKLLEEGFGTGASIATITDIVIMLGQQHGKYGGEWKEGAETLVTLSQLAQIENMALTAVRDAAEDGSLLGAPKMVDAIGCWATWNRGECRAWVGRVIGDDEGLVAFLQPFMRSAGQPSASARGPRVENRLDHRRLRPFLEPGGIVERVRDLAERPERSEQERQLMRRFVLDHELLQQATSAEYAEGEQSTQSDSYAA
ncbi:MAG TPA: P-loop NTPase fold protein [Gaiellales bacterium]